MPTTNAVVYPTACVVDHPDARLVALNAPGELVPVGLTSLASLMLRCGTCVPPVAGQARDCCRSCGRRWSHLLSDASCRPVVQRMTQTGPAYCSGTGGLQPRWFVGDVDGRDPFDRQKPRRAWATNPYRARPGRLSRWPSVGIGWALRMRRARCHAEDRAGRPRSVRTRYPRGRITARAADSRS